MSTETNPQEREAAQGPRVPMILIERQKDGSLYIVQGSPDAGYHQAFDICCDRPTAEQVVESFNSHAALTAEVQRLREALVAIRANENGSKFGPGICCYGCDSPHIANLALTQPPRPTQREGA